MIQVNSIHPDQAHKYLKWNELKLMKNKYLDFRFEDLCNIISVKRYLEPILVPYEIGTKKESSLFWMLIESTYLGPNKY